MSQQELAEYKQLLSQYWSEIVEAKNWNPDRQADLSRRMGALVRTDQDKAIAQQLQDTMYQQKIK